MTRIKTSESEWHLFEFMDQNWLPASLRQTLRDILECGNGPPFRGYYDWVASETVRIANECNIRMIVELGAGTAPITRRLASDTRTEKLRLVVCDLNPDRTLYEQLEKHFSGRVQALREPVDFSVPHDWGTGTLLLLSATFHHVPSKERDLLLEALARSADAVLIFEPLRRTTLSYLFVCLSIVPALLVPLIQWSRPGRMRRFLWCWLLPVAPVLFLWDGWVSCWRQWTDRQWDRAIRYLLAKQPFEIQLRQKLFSQEVQIIASSAAKDIHE